MAETKCKLS